jgi:hypothetical protein
VLDAVASGAWKRPWAWLGAALVLLAVLALLAVGVRDRLGHPDGSSVAEPGVTVLVSSPAKVSGAAYDVALEAITARLEARPDVTSVTAVEKADPKSTRLELDTGSAGAAEERSLAQGLQAEIDPGPLRVVVEGRVSELLAAEDTALDGLWRLELLIVPLVVLLLVAVLGFRIAAGPILCAAIGVAGGLAGLSLAGSVADLSLLGVAATAAVGLALGIEFPALLAARWEDEVRLDRPEQALANALADGFGPLCLAAACATLGGGSIAVAYFAGAFEPGLAIAIGTAFAAAFATLGCLLTLPPLLALDGRRQGEAAEGRGERRLADTAATLPRVLARGRVRCAASVLLAVLTCAALAATATGMDSRPLVETPLEPFGKSLAPAAGVLAAVLVLAYVARARTLRAAPLALLPILPAGAGLGITALVFGDASLVTGAVAAGLAVIAAVAAARTANGLAAVASERELDPGAPGVAERAAELTMPAAILCTLVGAAAFGVLTSAELAAAHQLGVLLASGLLADLLLRPPAIAALARWGAPSEPAPSGASRRRLGWPAWRRSQKNPLTTDSPAS